MKSLIFLSALILQKLNEGDGEHTFSAEGWKELTKYLEFIDMAQFVRIITL